MEEKRGGSGTCDKATKDTARGGSVEESSAYSVMESMGAL